MSDENEEVNPYKLESDPGFEVYENQRGQVVIKQDPSDGTEDSYVRVSPERVEKLIEFLRAVRDEILTARADAAAERAQI